jgi:hypothetical protein
VSKKAAWYSMLPPIVISLIILTVALILSGQASLEIFMVIVAAVLIGSVGGAVTRALIERRRGGSGD